MLYVYKRIKSSIDVPAIANFAMALAKLIRPIINKLL